MAKVLIPTLASSIRMVLDFCINVNQCQAMPTITCPQCGEGRIALCDVYPDLAKTIQTLYKAPGKTPAELALKFRCMNEVAMNARLRRLLDIGLVRRERDGRAWRYYPV